MYPLQDQLLDHSKVYLFNPITHKLKDYPMLPIMYWIAQLDKHLFSILCQVQLVNSDRLYLLFNHQLQSKHKNKLKINNQKSLLNNLNQLKDS